MGVLIRYARPSGDTARGAAWTDESGGTSNIYTHINEATLDEATYLKFAVDSGGPIYTATLSAVTDPIVHTNHVFGFVARKTGSGGWPQLLIDISNTGGTSVVSGVAYASSAISTDTFRPESFTLSEAEAAAIVNYGNLSFSLYKAASGGAGSRYEIAQVYMSTQVTVGDGGDSGYKGRIFSVSGKKKQKWMFRGR